MRVNDVRARGRCDRCREFTETARYGLDVDLCDHCAIDLDTEAAYTVVRGGETPLHATRGEN